MGNDKTAIDTKTTDIQQLNLVSVSSSLVQAINSWAETAAPIINSINSTIKYLSDLIASSNVSEYMASFSEAMASFGEAIKKATNDPYSYINFMDYQKKLDSYHWAWPYGITPEELRRLLEQATDEKSFDRIMQSFFSRERINDMFSYTLGNLPRKHQKIFSQIMVSYRQKHYALINNALLSILDNTLSEVLKDKGCVTRKGLLLPIINYYANKYCLHEIPFIFEMQMLSNSIDLIFANYHFSEKITLESNKTVRRHLSMHGVRYSNEKIDSVMLINTLAALLRNQPYIKPFKNSLKYTRKERKFILDLKAYTLKNRIRKQLKLEEV